jgi:hypothetical protein
VKLGFLSRGLFGWCERWVGVCGVGCDEFVYVL